MASSTPSVTILQHEPPAPPALLGRFLSEAGLRPGRDVSILALLPEARAQYLIPTLTSYQTDWTEIGRRLGEAVTPLAAMLTDSVAVVGACFSLPIIPRATPRWDGHRVRVVGCSCLLYYNMDMVNSE